jgi:O-antigen/teichoic acid export membrane protein
VDPANPDPEVGPAPPKPAPGHIVQVAKQTLIYGLSGVSIQLAGVITLPIYARVFSPRDYGVLELTMVGSAVALTFIDGGFSSAAQRSFYDYGEDQAEERRSVIFTATAVTTLLACLVAGAAIVARDPVSSWLFNGQQRPWLIIAAALSLPLINVANFARETMRLRFRAWSYVISSVLAAGISAGVGVFAVLVFDAGVTGVIVGVVSGSAFAALYGLLAVRGDMALRFSGLEMRRMFAFGLPLIPTALALWALSFLDRIMLGKLSTLGEVGQYAVANRVAGVLLFVVLGFTAAVGPQLLSLYSEDPELEKHVRGRILTYLTVALSLGGIFLSLFAREIVRVAAPDYTTAYEAVGLVSLAVVAFGVSSVVMAGIAYMRRTLFYAVGSGVALVVHVGLNFALMPSLGMVGAAISTAVGYTILAWFYFVVSQRLYPTRYDVGKVLGVLSLATAAGTLGVVPLGPPASSLPLKLLIVLGFLIAVRVTGIINAEEAREIRSFFGGMLRGAEARG